MLFLCLGIGVAVKEMLVSSDLRREIHGTFFPPTTLGGEFSAYMTFFYIALVYSLGENA